MTARTKALLYAFAALATFAIEMVRFDYQTVNQFASILLINLILSALWPLHWLVALMH